MTRTNLHSVAQPTFQRWRQSATVPAMFRHLLNSSEASMYLNIDNATLDRLVGMRVVPFVILPGTTEIRFDQDDLFDFVAAAKTGTRALPADRCAEYPVSQRPAAVVP